MPAEFVEDLLTEHYRIAPRFFSLQEMRGGEPGYFRIGDVTCWGDPGQESAAPGFHEAPAAKQWLVGDDDRRPRTTFSPTSVAESLRREKYVEKGKEPTGLGREIYYRLRPWLPVPVRRHLQRFHLRGWDRRPFPRWPVDTTVEELARLVLSAVLRHSERSEAPFVWFWPDGCQGAVTLTHDVETAEGLRRLPGLLRLERSYGFKASVQIIPEVRYSISNDQLAEIRDLGAEVNIHGLNHDGRLFDSLEVFRSRAARINDYGRQFGARGFRSPVLYRNPDWLGLLDFEYEMSFPNVGHLDPQPGGCCTVFPYMIDDTLEIPLTTTQDYSLFNVIRDFSISLWKRQIGRILSHHGLASFNIHPDYLVSSREEGTITRLMDYLRDLVESRNLWATQPAEINDWWRYRAGIYPEDMNSDRSGWGSRLKLGRARIRGTGPTLELSC